MEVETVSTADQSLLRGIRRALAGADSALLCVAFVHPRGVHLLHKLIKLKPSSSSPSPSSPSSSSFSIPPQQPGGRE